MIGVAITLPVQWSAESWELVFKIRRRIISLSSVVMSHILIRIFGITETLK